MRMEADRARALLGASRVARLATASPAGEPHLVPVTFALDGGMLYFAIDHKPKSTTALRRLQNIRENSRVSVLVDHYADDWSTLWWVRADGQAEIWEDGSQRARPVELLASKYPQYREQPPQGAVVAISVDRLTGWSYVG